MLQPGRAVLSAVQHAPVVGDRGYPGGSSRGLYAPSDLVPMKPRADVLLVARDKPPARSLVARLAVGQIDKRVDLGSSDGSLAALGPIAATWPPRAALLGSKAEAQRPDDWQGRVTPSQLDEAYFNTAPVDQQLDEIRDDERITVENMLPAHPHLVTALPGIRPLAVVEGPGHRPRALVMRADTLWIEASQGICALVWRGQVALDRGLPQRVLVDVFSQEAPQEAPHEAPSAPVRRAPAWQQETLGIASDQTFHEARLPFLPSTAPQRTENVGGGLPFRPTEDTSPQPPAIMPVGVAPSSAIAEDASTVSPWARGRLSARVDPAEPSLPKSTEAPAPDAPRPPADTIQLVWLDPKSPPRVRRKPRFKAILEAMDDTLPDLDLDEAGDIADREDRRDLFEILAKGEVSDDVAQALDRGVLDDGRLLHPIVLVAGDLALAFDELDALKATISAAAPHAGSDPVVKAAIDTAQAFLISPGAGHGPAIAEAVTSRIRAALLEKKLVASAENLDAEVTRGLLDARAFQHRRVLGAPHARALLSLQHSNARDATALPVYLEEALAAALPRTERLRVKLLAVVHPRMDPRESSDVALQPVAMAVVTRSVQP